MPKKRVKPITKTILKRLINKKSMSKTTREDGGEPNRAIIGESTPIRVGLVISFLAIFGSAIWWASGISAKLDTLIASQTSINATITALQATDISINKDINEDKLRLSLIESDVKSLKDKVGSK